MLVVMLFLLADKQSAVLHQQVVDGLEKELFRLQSDMKLEMKNSSTCHVSCQLANISICGVSIQSFVTVCFVFVLCLFLFYVFCEVVTPYVRYIMKLTVDNIIFDVLLKFKSLMMAVILKFHFILVVFSL